MIEKNIELFAVQQFKCLADKCPNNCCSASWTVPVGKDIVEKYKEKAPCLLNSLDQIGENYALKKNEQNSCVNLENGLCALHKTHGEDFLSDACHIYPRIIKKFHDNYLTSLSLSCIETVRIIFSSEKLNFRQSFAKPKRIQAQIKNLLDGQEISFDEAFQINAQIINLFSQDHGIAIRKLAFIARSFDQLPKNDWLELVNLILPSLEIQEEFAENSANIFQLLQFILLISKSTGQKIPTQLKLLIGHICNFLKVRVDFENCAIIMLDANLDLKMKIRELEKFSAFAQIDEIMKKFCSLQILNHAFPFVDLNGKISDIANLLIVKFACLKLALFATLQHFGEKTIPQDFFQTISILSRLLDHSPNHIFAINIINDFGWNYESEISSLMNFPSEVLENI